MGKLCLLGSRKASVDRSDRGAGTSRVYRISPDGGGANAPGSRITWARMQRRESLSCTVTKCVQAPRGVSGSTIRNLICRDFETIPVMPMSLGDFPFKRNRNPLAI